MRSERTGMSLIQRETSFPVENFLKDTIIVARQIRIVKKFPEGGERMAAIKYWLWLTSLKDFGAVSAMRVLDHFVTPERAFYADPEEYDQVEGLTPAQRLALRRRDLTRAEEILADCERLSLRVMTIQDGDYPERLLPHLVAPAPLDSATIV